MEVTKDTSFGERIKLLREELNLTQEDLGSMVGCKKQAIYRLEKDQIKNPNNFLIKKLAYELNCTVDFLKRLSDNSKANQTGTRPAIFFDPEPDSGIINDLYSLYEQKPSFTSKVLQCAQSLSSSDIEVLERVMMSFINESKLSERNQ